MKAQMARPILDDMVMRRLEVMEARKLGLQITDQEVLRAAQAIPGLYQNGKFIGRDAFEQLSGTTEERFLTELRETLLLQKLQAVVTDGIRVTSQEVHAEFVKRNTKAQIAYVRFDPNTLEKAVTVTPQALEDFYKRDPNQYAVPEERQVRYVLIDLDAVRAQMKVSDAEVKQYYQQHLADYRVPERAKVAHLLFKTTGKTPQETAIIEKTAKDVLAQVRAGKDFGELAGKYSEDSSASKGGEIGWIIRGQTVKEFEDVAFSLPPGQTSDIVKTIYGIHIIKVEDRQPAHLQSFTEASAEIRTAIEKQELADAQRRLAESLAQQLKANPTGFEGVARKAGLKVNETPLFKYKQVIPDFGNSESFSNLAFQLRPGEVGQPFNVPKGVAVIQLAQSLPAHVPPLDEVRERVEQLYRAEQSRVVAGEKAQAFASQAKTGDFKAIARTMGLTVKESKEFAEQDYVPDLGSAAALPAAFTLAPGQTSDVVKTASGDVVFRLISRASPNEADFAAQRDSIVEQLVQKKRSLAFELYRENLKEQMARSGDLKMNEAAMKQFLAAYQGS
jgi:peptidyl-prolyl cis-trans isomerase D